MSARKARQIRRRCQRRSQRPDHFGISELWLAAPEDQAAILATTDRRLQMWLLGFTIVPEALLNRFRALGWVWCA